MRQLTILLLPPQRRRPAGYGLIAADDLARDQRLQTRLQGFFPLQQLFDAVGADQIELHRRGRVEQTAQFDLIGQQIGRRFLQRTDVVAGLQSPESERGENGKQRKRHDAGTIRLQARPMRAAGAEGLCDPAGPRVSGAVNIGNQHSTVSHAKINPSPENTAIWRSPGKGVSARPR